jgi:hypothetical protein
MGVGHKFGKIVLDTVELVHRVIVPLPFFTLDLELEVPFQDVSGETLRSRLAFQWIFPELSEVLLVSFKFTLLMCGRFVVELAVVTGDAELLDNAKHRKDLRTIEQSFRKNLIVKQVQAPRPEPNQIDQENGDGDNDHRKDSKYPF